MSVWENREIEVSNLFLQLHTFTNYFDDFYNFCYFANDSLILTRNIWAKNLGQLLTFLFKTPK